MSRPKHERFIVDLPKEVFKTLTPQSSSFVVSHLLRDTLMTPQNFLRVRFTHNSRFMEYEYEGAEDLGLGIKVHLGDFKHKH